MTEVFVISSLFYRYFFYESRFKNYPLSTKKPCSFMKNTVSYKSSDKRSNRNINRVQSRIVSQDYINFILIFVRLKLKKWNKISLYFNFHLFWIKIRSVMWYTVVPFIFYEIIHYSKVTHCFHVVNLHPTWSIFRPLYCQT